MKKRNVLFLMIISIIFLPLNVFAGSNDCVEIFGQNSQTLEFLQDVYGFMKFLVPIILLAMSIKDFATALSQQESSDLKKATNNLFQRIIISVLILLMPTILNFIFKLVGYSTCTL